MAEVICRELIKFFNNAPLSVHFEEASVGARQYIAIRKFGNTPHTVTNFGVLHQFSEGFASNENGVNPFLPTNQKSYSAHLFGQLKALVKAKFFSSKTYHNLALSFWTSYLKPHSPLVFRVMASIVSLKKFNVGGLPCLSHHQKLETCTLVPLVHILPKRHACIGLFCFAKP